MDEIKLKNCPFCGGEARLTAKDDGIASYWFVECANCHARSDDFDELVHDAFEKDFDVYQVRLEACRDAAKAWNRRTGDGNDEVGS